MQQNLHFVASAITLSNSITYGDKPDVRSTAPLIFLLLGRRAQSMMERTGSYDTKKAKNGIVQVRARTADLYSVNLRHKISHRRHNLLKIWWT